MQTCKEMKTECLLIIQMPRTVWLYHVEAYLQIDIVEIHKATNNVYCKYCTVCFWVNCLCCQGCYSQVHECKDTRLVRSLQRSQIYSDEASLVVEGQQSLQPTGGHQEPYRYSTVVHVNWCQDQGFNYRWDSPTLGWVRGVGGKFMCPKIMFL